MVANEPPDSIGERGSTVRRVALPVGLTILLVALVALGSRGAPDAAGQASRSAGLGVLLLEVIASIGLVMAMVGVWLFVALWSGRRKAKPEAKRVAEEPQVHWAIKLLLLALLAALIFGIVTVLRALAGAEPTESLVFIVPGGGLAGIAPSSEAPDVPPFPWVLAAVVAACVVLGGLIWWRFFRDAESAATRESQAVFERALDDGLAALERESDPRRAVILAYVAMERSLARHGLPRRSAEVPVEYMLRVLHELPNCAEPVNQLTDLFEEARFSQHVITVRSRDGAVHALGLIRAALVPLAT